MMMRMRLRGGFVKPWAPAAFNRASQLEGAGSDGTFSTHLHAAVVTGLEVAGRHDPHCAWAVCSAAMG